VSEEIVCPFCTNRDRTLLEPRLLFYKTLWLCIVCSKVFTEPKPERREK